MAKSPYEISLSTVMGTLDGTSAPLNCIEEPAGCTLHSTCTQRDVWQSVDQVMQSVLSSTSIGELAQSQSRLASRGMYQI